MKVQCDRCEATYNIPDHKIPESAVKLKCLKCKNIIILDKQKDVTEKATTDSPAQSQNEFINKTKEAAVSWSEKAVNLGKKAKEKATGFKELANEKTSLYLRKSEKSKNSITKLNRFLFFSFNIGKYISAFCIVLFFLVFIGSIIFYFTRFSTSFNKPKFNPNLFKENRAGETQNYDFSNVDERKRVRDKFDKKIKEVVNLGFKEEAYNWFVDLLIDYPEKYRDAYISGLCEYLKDAKKDAAKNKSEYDVAKLFESYVSMFKSEIARVEFENNSAKIGKLIVLGIIVVSMLFYIVFLLIPILIKIEENTRLKSSETSPNLGSNFDEFHADSEPMINRPSHHLTNHVPSPT